MIKLIPTLIESEKDFNAGMLVGGYQQYYFRVVVKKGDIRLDPVDDFYMNMLKVAVLMSSEMDYNPKFNITHEFMAKMFFAAKDVSPTRINDDLELGVCMGLLCGLPNSVYGESTANIIIDKFLKESVDKDKASLLHFLKSLIGDGGKTLIERVIIRANEELPTIHFEHDEYFQEFWATVDEGYNCKEMDELMAILDEMGFYNKSIYIPCDIKCIHAISYGSFDPDHVPEYLVMNSADMPNEFRFSEKMVHDIKCDVVITAKQSHHVGYSRKELSLLLDILSGEGRLVPIMQEVRSDLYAVGFAADEIYKAFLPIGEFGQPSEDPKHVAVREFIGKILDKRISYGFAHYILKVPFDGKDVSIYFKR